MTELVRVGIIGTGVGVRTLLPGLRNTGSAEVVAISGSSKERAQEVAAQHDIPRACASYEELVGLSDIDLICVASPNQFHVQHSSAALATGKHVYLEKPIGSTASEAEQVSQALRASDNPQRIVVVGHQLRFNPYLSWLRDQLISGIAGRPYHVAIRQRAGGFVDPSRPWTWEFDESRGGGVRLAMGSHMLDLVSYLLGRDPVIVEAHCDPVHRERTPDGASIRSVVASNYFAMMADYGDCNALMSTSAASHAHGGFDVEILTTEGAYTFDGASPLVSFVDGEPQSRVVDVDWEEYQNRPGSSIFRKSFTYMAEDLVAAINGQPSRISRAATVAQGVLVMKNLDDALLDYVTRLSDSRPGF